MQLQKRILALAVILAAALSGLPATLLAGEISLPNVPKAAKKADPKTWCVRPVEDMRKNHMDYILHQRDETMHKGVRTKQFSLAECVDCHVTPDEKGQYASYGDDRHFCSSCHNYAAVQIDCFECHRDKPRDVNYNHSLIDKSLLEKYNPHAESATGLTTKPKIDDKTLDDLTQIDRRPANVE